MMLKILREIKLVRKAPIMAPGKVAIANIIADLISTRFIFKYAHDPEAAFKKTTPKEILVMASGFISG